MARIGLLLVLIAVKVVAVTVVKALANAALAVANAANSVIVVNLASAAVLAIVVNSVTVASLLVAVKVNVARSVANVVKFGGERRGFGDRDRRPAFGGQRRREEFGVRSGPRARALETRRFSERSDFAKSAIVKLDADLADYFDSAEAVNKALRMVVQLAQIAKKPTPAKVEEKTTEATEVAAEEAEVTEDAVADEAMFSEDDFEEQMPQADVEAEDKKAE